MKMKKNNEIGEVKLDREQFKEFIKCAKNIENKLDTLIIFMKLMAPKPKLGKEEAEILKLCNKKNNISDMVKKLEKTEKNVGVVLTNLRKKGYIKSTIMNDKYVYMKI